MADRNLDIALRIKADMKDAQAQIDAINKTVTNTGKSADTGKAGLGRLSQQLDALVTNTGQAVQWLQGMDERMAALVQSSVQAARATSTVEAGARAAAEGIKAVGESEAEATARIRDMIAASREQAAAEQTAAAATQEASTAAQQHAASVQDTAAIVQRQNAQMRQSSVAAAEMAAAERKTTASTEDQTAALGRLLGQIDPTIAAFERLDQQEAELARFHKAGAIDAQDFQAFRTQIEASRAALNRMGISAGQTRQAMRQLPAQITDVTVSLAAGMPVWLVFLQQGSQIKDSFGGVKPAIQGVLSVLTPFRVAIGATVGVIGLLGAAAIAGYRQEEQLSSSIIRTGNYAGITSGQIEQLATSFGAVNGRTGEARDILNGLVGTGKIAGDALASVGRAAVNMAALSGKSAQEVVQEFSRMADDPVRAAIELDNQYHFLNITLFQQIQTLQQAGDQYGALKLIAGAFADDTAKKMDELHQHMGWLETFADKWSRGFDNIKTSLFDLGKPATEIAKFQEALKTYNYYNTQYKKFAAANPDSAATATYLQAAKEAYKTLQDAQSAALKSQSDAAAKGVAQQVQADGKAAAKSIDQLTTSLDRAKQQQEALNKAADDLYKIHLAGGKLPEGINFNGPQADMPQGPGWDKLVAQINQRYATHTPKQTDKQAAIDRAAATAQQALIDSLAQMQGELDPVAAAWVKYNQAVAQADKQAATAKQGHNANAAAIDGERNAVVANAAAVRDAALAALADKDRQAWDQLRGSLGTPVEVHTAQAVKKLQALYALIDKLKTTKDAVSGKDVDAAVGDLLDHSLPAMPRARSLRGLPGGAVDASQTGLGAAMHDMASQNAWFKESQQELATLRTAALADAQKYGQDTLAVQQQFDQKQRDLSAQHQQAVSAIQQAQYWGEVQIASAAFGQLAQVAAQRYGQDSKQYRLLFALSKTFAIAQAAVSLATNVAKASEAGFPYNIPFIIGAFAQGAEIAALVGGASFGGGGSGGGAGGYAEGGYTGPGGKYQVAGVVHAGEGVLSQRDMSALGGPAAFEAFRRGLHGYADGGFVSPLAGVPAPSLPTSPRAPSLFAGDAGRGGTSLTLHNHNYIDIDELRDRIMTGPKAEAHTVNHVLRNGRTVKQGIG